MTLPLATFMVLITMALVSIIAPGTIPVVAGLTLIALVLIQTIHESHRRRAR